MSWIIDHIRKQGDKVAIVFNSNEYTYKQLSVKIDLFYQEISTRINKGETVAIISDYSFEAIALFFALHKNKNIIVPITTKVDKEIEERIEVAACNYAIKIIDGELSLSTFSMEGESHSLIAGLRTQSQSGLILFSSGSTGQPKAMIHNLDNLVDSYQNKKGKTFVFLIFLMFDHIGGLNTLLNCFSMGVKMVFPTDRNPENVCALIEKYQVNVLPASPTFLNLILISQANLNYNLSSLKMITYGTEPMPESLLLKLKESFPSVKFLQTFGTSETGISQTASKSSASTFIKLDDPNIEYKVVDNELWLKSKTQILGYLNSSMERFTEDGWFRTGDVVEQSEDGYLRIIGRGSEIINVGGEKVLPSEVESILFQMPEVDDCVVYAEKNPIMGQMVVAKVLFNKELKASEAKNLVREFCVDKLDRYKIPVKVLLMSESEYSERFKKKRI